MTSHRLVFSESAKNRKLSMASTLTVYVTNLVDRNLEKLNGGLNEDLTGNVDGNLNGNLSGNMIGNSDGNLNLKLNGT